MNSFVLSSAAVLLALLLGVPAAYAFARFKFRLGESIAFTLLSFRFAPPLLVLLPLSLYYQELGLNDTYFGIVWVYQLIALPLILWIVRPLAFISLRNGICARLRPIFAAYHTHFTLGTARYRRLVAKGKMPVVVITAIAREMIGFIWAIARQVQLQTA